MAKVPAIIPVSDLRQDAARVLSDAAKSSQPVFITQRGRATAVLMSIGAFERSEAEREVLLLLARGEKEIAAAVGYPLDQVLAEADSLIRLMKERDELHQGKLAELRRDIAVAVEQADQGQVHPFDEETTARVKERGRKRLGTQKGPKPA